LLVRDRVKTISTILFPKTLKRPGILETEVELIFARPLSVRSIIKFYVANAENRVVDRALQVRGGLGISDDTPIAGFYRDERAARIYDGAAAVHKLSVAKRILREF